MSLKSGDRVRVVDGPYQGWEGEVVRVEVDTRVTVVIPIFARLTALDFRSSQIERL
jgi:transcription antitermination factor NusG